MTATSQIGSLNRLARTAGALYLLIAVCGAFAIGYLPSVLIVPGDAVATAQNLAGKIGLARIGLLMEVVVMLAEIGLTAILFHLLKPVNEMTARTAAWARLSMVAIMGINIMLSAMALSIVSGAAMPGDVAAQVSGLIELRDIGVKLWGFFFALHLALLGWLVLRAPYLPHIFGVLIGLGSIGYLFDSLETFAAPGNEVVIAVAMVFLGVSMIGEIGFMVYLLIRGLNTERWDARAA